MQQNNRKFPKSQKELSIRVQEASRTPNNLIKIEPPLGILSLKEQAQRTEKIY
jgi:hypothetical protein